MYLLYDDLLLERTHIETILELKSTNTRKSSPVECLVSTEIKSRPTH